MRNTFTFMVAPSPSSFAAVGPNRKRLRIDYQLARLLKMKNAPIEMFAAHWAAGLVLLLGIAAIGTGCDSAGMPPHDKESLARRTSQALIEVGAEPPLMRCLTAGLDAHLTEADAEVAYEDLASEPEVSEKALISISLVDPSVKRWLLRKAPICQAALVSSGRYSVAEFREMLRDIGAKGYRNPRLFLEN